MRLSEWRKKAPSRESLSTRVLATLEPVLAALGTDADPYCWIVWGDDPEIRYSVLVPTRAGLVNVAVRVNIPDEGPRASGKLIRWSRLQTSELSVDGQGGHRLVAVQVEGQVLRGVDDEADAVAAFFRSLIAAVDGQAFQAPEPAAAPAPRPRPAKPEKPPAASRASTKPSRLPVPARDSARRPRPDEEPAADAAAPSRSRRGGS